MTLYSVDEEQGNRLIESALRKKLIQSGDEFEMGSVLVQVEDETCVGDLVVLAPASSSRAVQKQGLIRPLGRRKMKDIEEDDQPAAAAAVDYSRFKTFFSVGKDALTCERKVEETTENLSSNVVHEAACPPAAASSSRSAADVLCLLNSPPASLPPTLTTRLAYSPGDMRIRPGLKAAKPSSIIEKRMSSEMDVFR